ncbi:bifunctional riboflavin kinase/FAD synthetase [Clostridium sp.]|jgi:riboflavin kinase/FMN adenylyltransferase|uniref:bifunctional riboflavin kinase/FAD synthetase n=1 Tax=Clostridium sp. TaxID=1506 RepID=UPI0025B7ADC9|nr:bifunctional riboflavin kinase/FAD synthetase [Clostridium sp.]MCI9070123.1 bifunctional riboflavin kinase/FAD synthetase [Clostridium sp.]
MLIYDNKAFDKESKNNYIALGSFDGLHLGHLSLIEKVKDLALKNNGKSIVFTFKNHPRKFLNTNNKIQLIMTNEEKINILQNKKVDMLAFKSFDEKIMKMMPDEFIKWLCKSYNVKGIVVGFNFKFGYKNLGDIETLEKFQEEYKYKLYVMKPCKIQDEIISSTAIRKELLDGNVKKAFSMLSRPYMLSGKVIDGKKLGRTIGFPTANLEINKEKVIPKKGVYYTTVKIEEKIFKGITSVGNNPTVNGQELTLETYILDFNEDIYGKEINVYFIDRIRDEVKFNNINELVEQLKKDKKFAEGKKKYIANMN